MKTFFKYFLVLALIICSCRNNSGTKTNDDRKVSDGDSSVLNEKKPLAALKENSTNANQTTVNPSAPHKDAKTVEVEIRKLNPVDTLQKMSTFHSDLKYFKTDSIYCELLYKLKEVKVLTKEKNSEGDYVSMMVDERPAGSDKYYQIALYKIRVQLGKMDRLETYRIDVKTHQIEKHDVVKDKWIVVK